MKRLVLALLSLMALSPMPGQAQENRQRTCATMNVNARLLQTVPGYARSREEIETFTRNYLRFRARLDPGARNNVVRIPVVVHVVSRTATENISDAQIQSQINVLNQDYRRLNADIGSVPAPFQPLTADTRIEFALAVRDPNCMPTTGITRTSTTVNGFIDDDKVKSSLTGGHNAWPADRYLNIWVAKLNGGLLGYAQFPGGPASTDGVVIAFDAFGNTGTAAFPFNLGRTATHEIGHWLNLNHIWGDDGNGCGGTDNVADTPNQAGLNTGVPSFPHVSCSNGPDGDMFMNYMDYTDDRGMFMFTQGQGERMEGALFGPHAAILGSDGLIPAPASMFADLYAQDTPADIGNEPNSESGGVMWDSDDIWVRRQNDGFINQQHQNPIYRPASPNYIYVRVRNRGCLDASSATLKTYWAKASTGLAWPSPWDGSVTSPALMGGSVGTQATGAVTAGDFVILEFPWSPPNPNDYTAFGTDKAHFCLLARIETSATAPYGMTLPETADLFANVRNNNNIVWKNVSVAEADGGGRSACVTVSNFTRDRMLVRLNFNTPDGRNQEPSLLRWGTIRVQLDPTLFARWRAGGSVGRGVEASADGVIQIFSPDAYIENIRLDPKDVFGVCAMFAPFRGTPRQNTLFDFTVTQIAQEGDRLRTVGGERFTIKETYRADEPQPFLLNGLVTLEDYLGEATSVDATIEVRDPQRYTFAQGQFSEVFATTLLRTRGGPGFSVATNLTGPVDVAVKPSHWLRQTQHNIELNAQTPTLQFRVRNGDANGDNSADALDLAALIDAFNSSVQDPFYNPSADFNGDFFVDALDLAVLIENFNTEGDL